MAEEEQEPLACEEIQAQVDVAISKFVGKAGSVVLPMGLLFNSYHFHNKHYGFTLEGDLTVYGGCEKEIVIKRDR
jgi:hypothetical protein